MNCFTYTVTKKQLRKLCKEGTFTVAAYHTQILPAEGDRIYFNNFKEVFTVEKVTPAEGTISDELAHSYFVGFFELALRQLYDSFEIVSVLGLYESGDFHESGFVANDAADLYAQFEVELALAEARSEGRLKLSEEDEHRIIAETTHEAISDFWSRANPSTYSPDGGCYEIGVRRLFKVQYDPTVVYIDDYEPLAMMLFYHEHDLDNNEIMESISAAYVDMEVAKRYNLTTEDIQYIVEELFFDTLLDFDPETAVAIMENPTITIPTSQVIFYEGLIDGNGWKADHESYFGYRVFN